MFRWIVRLFASQSQPCADGVSAARPDATAKVEEEKAKADFEAAAKRWPRDPAATARAYKRLRDARGSR